MDLAIAFWFGVIVGGAIACVVIAVLGSARAVVHDLPEVQPMDPLIAELTARQEAVYGDKARKSE